MQRLRQSAVHVIRGMALSRVTGWETVVPEFFNGILLASMLVVIGFARIYMLQGADSVPKPPDILFLIWGLRSTR